MTHDPEYENHFVADEGKVLLNRVSGAFGKEVWLADWDDIVNWDEVNEEDVNA